MLLYKSYITDMVTYIFPMFLFTKAINVPSNGTVAFQIAVRARYLRLEFLDWNGSQPCVGLQILACRAAGRRAVVCNIFVSDRSPITCKKSCIYEVLIFLSTAFDFEKRLYVQNQDIP